MSLMISVRLYQKSKLTGMTGEGYKVKVEWSRSLRPLSYLVLTVKVHRRV